MAIRTILLSIICMICTFRAECADHANSDYIFSHIKIADGLPHQQVQAMAFDHIGRLWIGTRNGLACYDGYSFKTYYHNPDDPASLCHNFVIQLLVDKQGDIWIGTEKGLCRYIPQTDSFRTYDVQGERIGTLVETGNGAIVIGATNLHCMQPGEDTFKIIPRQGSGYIVGMAVSPDNRVYVSTNKTLASYDSLFKQVSYVDSSVYSDFLVGFDDIVPLYFDRAGKLWIGRNGKGVMQLDVNTGKYKIYGEDMLNDGTVRAITQDQSGKIWIGTEKGINVIDPDADTIASIRSDFVNAHKLNDNAIYCIVPDQFGNMWIGTYFGGINLVNKKFTKFNWYAPGYNEYDLHGKAVRKIIEPTPGTLWLATEDGGINILDLATRRIRQFNAIPSMGMNVHELYHDSSDGNIWVGTFLNGLYRYDLTKKTAKRYSAGDSGLGSNAIFSIVAQRRADGSDRIWIGTTAGLRYYVPETDTFATVNSSVLDVDFIYCMLADSDNNLWVGTLNSGLFRIDGATGRIQGWNISHDTPAGLKDCYITTLYQDKKGTIYVGTNNGGLYTITNADKTIRPFNANPNEYGTICSIAGDIDGNIWVSTSKGLLKISPSMALSRHFTTADGLPENQFNFASSLFASDGNFYFGTVNGLVSFSPDIRIAETVPQTVHLWNLSLNNQAVAPGSPDAPYESTLDDTKELHLDYSDSRLFTITYGIVDPASAGAVSYQILMEGIDKDWRDVGSQRSFTATDLASGTYRLRIRAAADGEAWDAAPVRELVIRIAPPFYLSVWAYIVYLVLLIAIVAIVWHLMQVRIRDKNDMRISRLEKEKSEELNRYKMEFFTNISHELKTPLSLILAPLKYISQHEKLGEDASKRLDVAIANTNKMVGLIDELVTFNRVESGNFQLYLQKGNPLAFIETMCSYFYEAAEQKHIAMHVYTEDNGEEVWFSTTYLERIIYNLLSNAIKYTPEEGRINVRASIEESADSNIYLNLEVKDSGIGIAPSELENIFRPYYQTKRGYSTSHQGWGIGLATVKKLVGIHKGEITVTSAMGEGSSFVVRLNVTAKAFDATSRIDNKATSSPEPTYIRTINAGLASSRPSAESVNAADRLSILLVEDNPELLGFLSDSFSKQYNVYTAVNGKDALNVIAEHQIDIVVSDVMMPEMDGIALCEHLKNNLNTSHIPVILLTAKNDQDSIMRGFAAGAEAYVAKPFDPEILELRVENILRGRRKFLNSIIDPKAEESDDAADVSGEDEISPVFNDFDRDFIRKMNDFVEANLENSEFAISDITAEFGISRSLLHVKMKSLFNASMTDFIRHKRMMVACSLLKSGLNVSETAYKAGYSDPNYFSKVFKKEFGVTPSEYISK